MDWLNLVDLTQNNWKYKSIWNIKPKKLQLLPIYLHGILILKPNKGQLSVTFTNW